MDYSIEDHMEPIKIKVYVTKYALTQGIIEFIGERCSNPKMIRRRVGGRQTEYYNKPYWHENKQDALNHVEKMRKSKIESLERKLTILKELKFQ